MKNNTEGITIIEKTIVTIADNQKKIIKKIDKLIAAGGRDDEMNGRKFQSHRGAFGGYGAENLASKLPSFATSAGD